MRASSAERTDKLSFRVPDEKSTHDVEGGVDSKYGKTILRGSRPGRLLRKHAWAPGVAFGAVCMLMLLYYLHRDQQAALMMLQKEDKLEGKPIQTPT